MTCWAYTWSRRVSSSGLRPPAAAYLATPLRNSRETEEEGLESAARAAAEAEVERLQHEIEALRRKAQPDR